jgi:hypothetical protein
MTDPFQFENSPDEPERLDRDEPDRPPADRAFEDPPDEGYAPPDRWSAAENYGVSAVEQLDGATFEHRLDQEEPEVEDDWDTELSDDPDGDDAAGVDPGADEDDGGPDDDDETQAADSRTGSLAQPNDTIGDQVVPELIGDDLGLDGDGPPSEGSAHTMPVGEDGR